MSARTCRSHPFLVALLSLCVTAPAIAKDLRGRIVDADDDPIAQVNVTVADQWSTVSDSAGTYALRRLPPGIHRVLFTHVSFERRALTYSTTSDTVLNVTLTRRVHDRQETTISASRGRGDWAIEPSSPVSHTALDAKYIEATRTTGDLPALAASVAGAWSSSAGLGESNLTLRGHASDRVSYFIDGMPMNEPENRDMNWADWAGLAGMVDAVQTVRGPSFIAQSMGAFGGAVHFHTREPEPNAVKRIRTSVAVFRTQGASRGRYEGLTATGDGLFVTSGAVRHLVAAFETHTGPVLNGRARFTFGVERKLGESYIRGTYYSGYAFSARGAASLGRHELGILFMGGPQEHEQADALQDPYLLKTLGREYSHVNHPWRMDRSWQLATALRDRIRLSSRHVLLVDVYGTSGWRNGARLIGGVFDVGNGTVGYQPVGNGTIDNNAFGRHAYYLEQRFGVIAQGYEPNLWTPSGGESTSTVTQPGWFNNYSLEPRSPAHLLTEQKTHSWQLGLRHNHHQAGLTAEIVTRQTPRWEWLLGGSARVWFGHRRGSAELFRLSDSLQDGQATLISDLQDVYHYNTRVSRLSVFGRTSFTLTPFASLHAGGQVMSVAKHVSEEPIGYFDFEPDISGTRFFPGYQTLITAQSSADQIRSTGEPRFCSCQYEEHYALASPWAGISLSMVGVDLYANVALSHREPAIADWYDPDRGPLSEDGDQQLLEAERMVSMDLGIREQYEDLEVSLGYYRATYDDKLESIVDELGRRQSINAGRAIYQGIEATLTGRVGPWSWQGNATMARNRWRKLAVENVFGADADVVEGNVVPFAPERSANFRLDHGRGRMMVGASLSWWDRYFGTYTNTHTDAQGRLSSSELPHFMDVGLHWSYRLREGDAPLVVRLDAGNLLNRWENYQRARLAIDSTRDDGLRGLPALYVLQAPLVHGYLTLQAQF
ncbi:MAG: TonB-dependent receptor [Gemmatimonadetes bacterium]|nr:TonB-dependent receptor [Gemmatimonadota bacterium]